MTACRVLVAEDETVIRLDVRSLLEAGGYEVCGEARNGVEAVELRRRSPARGEGGGASANFREPCNTAPGQRESEAAQSQLTPSGG
jgi:CheY-like chemotaxis protein